MAHIVIVGAGFTGLMLSRRLAKRRGTTDKITLIDPKDHFLFSPRLIDLLSGRPSQPWFSQPLSILTEAAGITLIQGRVQTIDRQRHEVTYQPMATAGAATSLSYDFLVICPGTRSYCYDIPGAETYSLPLKTRADVSRIHQQLHQCLAQALQTTADHQRDLLTITVIGAGASGVEAMFALKRYAERLLKAQAPELLPQLFFRLIQGSPEILPGFPISVIHGVRKQLEREKIQLLTGTMVTAMEAGAIFTNQQTRLATGLTLWAAGIIPEQLHIVPEVQRDRQGNILVDSYLQLDPKTFAAGDVVGYQEKNVTIPKNAQTAMLMAISICHNLEARLNHRPLRPFHYFSRGSIISLDDTGFISFGGVQLKSRFVPLFRDLFYRWRFRQITGCHHQRKP